MLSERANVVIVAVGLDPRNGVIVARRHVGDGIPVANGDKY